MDTVSYRKSLDEVKAYEEAFSAPSFWGRKYLTFEYETTPGAIERVVPPPLTVPAGSTVFAWVGDIEGSNCIGGVKAMGLFVRAQYEGIAGLYAVAMAVSTEVAAFFGSTRYGEPKKIADVEFEREGDNIRASVTRQGICYLEARGTLAGPKRVGKRMFNSFFFKYAPHHSGVGFEQPPRLILVRTTIDMYTANAAEGELILHDSPYDPVTDLPVARVRGVDYTESNNTIAAEVLCEVDPEAFRPFGFATIDTPDLLASSPEPAVAS